MDNFRRSRTPLRDRERSRDRDRDVRPVRESARERTTQRAPMTWYRMDLHLHTPASSDYRDPRAT